MKIINNYELKTMRNSNKTWMKRKIILISLQIYRINNIKIKRKNKNNLIWVNGLIKREKNIINS